MGAVESIVVVVVVVLTAGRVCTGVAATGGAGMAVLAAGVAGIF